MGAVIAILYLSEPSRAAPLDADAVVASALRRSPDVLEAEARVSAARGDVSATWFLMNNPVADGALSPDAASGDAQIVQPLSLTGEGLAARRQARQELDAATAGAERARLVAAAEARGALVDAIVARQQTTLASDVFAATRDLRQGIEKERATQEASDLDVRLARLEEVDAASRLLEARADERAALVRLSELTGVPIGALDLPTAPDVAVPSPVDADGLPPEQRSDVRAARSDEDAAKAGLARAHAAGFPPVELGVAWQRDSGASWIGPTVGFELPLWNRNQAGVGEAGGELLVAQGAVARAESRSLADADATASEVAAIDALGLAPTAASLDEAAAALRSIDAGYRAGQLDLADTLFLRSQALAGESSAIELGGQVARARIERLLATDDPALLGGSR